MSWIAVVNATASTTELRKTGGCDGCDDAGARSEAVMTASEAYAEFTVVSATALLAAGLGAGNSDTTYADIDYAFRFNGAGTADILENGVYRSGGDTAYAVGDVFRVAVRGGKVQYSRNGFVLYESTVAPQYPLLFDVSLRSAGAAIGSPRMSVSDPPPATGGFMDKSGSRWLRPRLTRAAIEAFLPPGGARGAFRFPRPYGTEGVRLTTSADCAGGADCVRDAGYSYWRNINNHVASNLMYILVSFDRARGGAGPSLISFDKLTNAVQNLGALFDQATPYSYSTAEGWYFSGTRPTTLYVFLPGGTQLRRFDVLQKQFEPLPALNLAECARPGVCPAAAAYIFQPHSSDNDQVHSATVQDADFRALGCVAYEAGPRRFRYVATTSGYVLDECHVDKSGRWLMVLEQSTSSGAVNNRVVDLLTGSVSTIPDVEGSLGHLDMGHGYAVGADNYNAYPNATIVVTFPPATTRPVGPVVHYNKRWDMAAANHIAHGNAMPGAPLAAQYACGSNASRVADMADEIICFSLSQNNADGTLDYLGVAPVMTDLDAPGGPGDAGDYHRLPKGNLDTTGRYFFWTTNMSGDRLDAFIVKVPPFGPLALGRMVADVEGPYTTGRPVRVTAVATGGSGAYEYKWWVYDTAWRPLTAWTTDATVAWTPPAVGSYRLAVWVRRAGSTADAPDSGLATGTYAVNVPAVTVTGLTADRPSPQPIGAAVTMTAAAVGGSGRYEYKWWLFDGQWRVAQDWASSPTFRWIPSAAGTYQIGVWVRAAGSAADLYDNRGAIGSLTFEATANPVLLASLTANRPSPQPTRTAVTFTAAASGGAGSYEYKWWIYDTQWRVLREWSADATVTWTPAAAGRYQIGVWIRNAGSTADSYDNRNAIGSLAFEIASASPVVLTGLTTDRPSPQPVGTPVVVSATASGGTGSYEYKWWVFNGTSWSIAREWGSASFTWTPSVAGNYRLAVWVRTAGSTADAADSSTANGAVPFTVTP